MFCGSCEDIIDPEDFLDENEKRMRKHRSGGGGATKTKHNKTNVFVHKHTINNNKHENDGESTMADEDDDESTMMDDGSRSSGSNSTNNNNEKKKKKVRRSDSMNVDVEDDGDGRSENSTSVGSTNVGSSMLDDNVSNVSTNASSIFGELGRNNNNNKNKNSIKKYNNNNNGSTGDSANDGNKNKNSCYQPLLDDRSSLGSIGSSGGVHPASPAKAAQATKALKVAKAAIAAKAAQRQAIINNKPTHKKKETEAQQQQQEEQGWPPPLSPATITKEQESLALQALLRGGSTGTATTTKDFFDRVYQTKCALFPCFSKRTGEKNDDDNNKQHTTTPKPKTTTTTTAADDSDDNTTNTADLLSTAWNESRMRSSPFEECVQQGWNILVHLLDELKLSDDDDDGDNDHITDDDDDDDDKKHNSLQDNDNKMDSRIEQQMKQIIQPMFFKGQSPVLEDDDDVDGGNGKLQGFQRDLFKAYLDGCNIICNHADLSSPWISLLCEDLQRSFPHVFANAYLTPPGSQAVKPHSDDRDVFVIQLTGAKHWKVYQRLPIPYPYTEEQVGKERLVGSSKPLKVPSYVLDGPLLVDAVLQPGDVLYMPRGYVHEAFGVPFANNGSGVDTTIPTSGTNGRTTTTTTTQPSFHITIALATHDWTLGKLMTQATEEILLSSSTHMLRKAISRSFGRYTNGDDDGGGFSSNSNNNNNGMNNNHNYDTLPSLQDQQNLQAQIDTAFSILKQKITSQAIHGMLQTKYSKHNQQAYYFRKRLLDKITKRQQQAMMNTTTQKSNKKNNSSIAGVVGIRASRTVTLRTVIRIATEYEKTVARTMMLSSQHQQHQQQRVGLQVREEIAEGIIHILTELKKNPRAHYEVGALRYALLATNPNNNNDGLICDLALLSFVKQCVAQGAVAVV